MKKIIFSAVLVFGLSAFARVLDANVLRSVDDDDGTKIIATAEGRTQVFFLKKSHPHYQALLNKLNSKQSSGSAAKFEINTGTMQFIENVRD